MLKYSKIRYVHFFVRRRPSKNCFAVFEKFFKVLKVIRTTSGALDRQYNVDLGGVLEVILNNSWKIKIYMKKTFLESLPSPTIVYKSASEACS